MDQKEIKKLSDIDEQEIKQLTGDENIGTLINIFFTIRETKAEIKTLEKQINNSYEIMVDKIIEYLQEQDLTRSEAKKGSVSISVKMHPSVEDKEAFTKWVVSEERYDMLQKRCSSPSIMEYFQLENKLPDGISTFMKTTLNVRTK